MPHNLLIVTFMFFQRACLTSVHVTMVCVAKPTSSVIVATTARIGVTRNIAVSDAFLFHIKQTFLLTAGWLGKLS